MPDRDDEVSETGKLAGGIYASIASFGETIGCLRHRRNGHRCDPSMR